MCSSLLAAGAGSSSAKIEVTGAALRFRCREEGVHRPFPAGFEPAIGMQKQAANRPMPRPPRRRADRRARAARRRPERQPSSAQSTVSSDEPPSATITSPISAELRSAASVSGKVSAALNVGMTTEIEICSCNCSHHDGIMPGMDMPVAVRQRKGRGAASNDSGRFEAEKRVAFDDGWGTAGRRAERH